MSFKGICIELKLYVDQKKQLYLIWTDGQPLQIHNFHRTAVDLSKPLCGMMDSADGMWRSVPCDQKKAFTCKVSKSNPSMIFFASKSLMVIFRNAIYVWSQWCMHFKLYRLTA